MLQFTLFIGCFEILTKISVIPGTLGQFLSTLLAQDNLGSHSTLIGTSLR